MTKNGEEKINCDVINYIDLTKKLLPEKNNFIMISHLELTAIPVNDIIINLEIDDELHDKKTTKEFSISALNLKLEYELANLTMDKIVNLLKEYQKDNYKEEINKMANSKEKTENKTIGINEINNSLNCTMDILKILVSSLDIKQNSYLNPKIIDIDNIMNGNFII